jgi:hypothetical protein
LFLPIHPHPVESIDNQQALRYFLRYSKAGKTCHG